MMILGIVVYANNGCFLSCRTKPSETKKTEKIIDLDLGIQLAGGDKELAQNLLKMLIEELPEFRKMITQAFQENNIKMLGDMAHKLHGGTCYCGTPNLKKAVKNLEQAARNNETKNIKKLYKNLNIEIEKVIKAFQDKNY